MKTGKIFSNMLKKKAYMKNVKTNLPGLDKINRNNELIYATS